MPLYDFRCPKCELEFEVSRPISRATDPAFCPLDGSASERVFTMPMTFVKSDPNAPTPVPKPPGGTNWTHFGHSHGTGIGGHSHGPAVPPSAGQGI
jgi:putative FmdB family regulatory protein